MASTNRTMVLRRIVIEDDRAVLYGDDERYHVIAKPDAELPPVGQLILYEPYGENFGWYCGIPTQSQTLPSGKPSFALLSTMEGSPNEIFFEREAKSLLQKRALVVIDELLDFANQPAAPSNPSEETTDGFD